LPRFRNVVTFSILLSGFIAVVLAVIVVEVGGSEIDFGGWDVFAEGPWGGIGCWNRLEIVIDKELHSRVGGRVGTGLVSISAKESGCGVGLSVFRTSVGVV
jgi:hypothetical protein